MIKKKEIKDLNLRFCEGKGKFDKSWESFLCFKFGIPQSCLNLLKETV